MNNLPPPSAFTIDQNDPNKWPKWRKKFENYIIASDLNSKTIQQQRAILLHIIGDSALEIYNTFGFEENAQSPTIKDILDKYDQYFRPFKNTIYKRYIFFTCEQKLNQTFDDFVTEIKSKAEDCEFENIKDSLIRDRIVLGCRDTTLREKYLQNPDLTLSLAINQGQAAEASQKQLRNIEKDSIDAIRENSNERYKPTTSLKNSYTSNPVRANFNKSIRCSKCNMAHDFGKCPAYGKECYKCRQPNHFANCCKNRAIRCIQEIEEEKDNLLIIDSIMVGQVLRKPWKELIYIQGHPVDIKLDTGADVNILPVSLIKEWPNMPLLETADCKIYTYTGQQIPVVGKCLLDCKTKYACRKVTFLIVNNSAVPILGLDECVKLNLVKRVETISDISVTLTGLLDEYKDVFKGNGHLSYTYDIKISDKAEPKICPARRLPRALLQPVKEELFKMEEDGIIEKIEEPTVWAHPMVVVRKPSGKYRICIDPRELNKWVLREHYTLPAPENILAEIPKAKFYSVLDAKSAFWQVPLSENTSKYLVMSTPFGRYRFLRLPFGISSAPEIFQKIMHKIFCDIPNVVCYIDDLLIWGNSIEDHNSTLKKVLDLARESKLKLTLNKLQMATGEVKFLGHTISQEGILPDQDKVRAIQNMQIPKNKQELQRILGTVTYLAKFIPDLSSNTSNMRNLLKKDIIWNWNIAADQELNFIKTLLTSPPVLRHFDPNEPLELFADASKDGLGAILMQKEKPLSYASASLTSPQKHYSQIEKELLALYFGCKRFHYFLYGRKFTAYTDHKPLVSLLKKNFDQMSPRLQRLSLYLLNYQFELKFIPGKSMIPADTLSRHFLPQEQMEDKELDLCSQTFVLNVEIKDQRLTRLQEDTLNDKECCLLKQYILTGWPLHKKNLPSNLKPYWEFKEELHEWQNLICRGNKLLIPKTQRSDILKILHASHQGINNTIALAKGFIYWPGMNKEIEELINNCSIRQQTSRANLKEPLLPHQAPEYPWQKVGIDIFQIESSKYLLIVDYFSKYPEIYQLQDMTTDIIIRRLKRTFSNFGIPETLVSDNGPPFFSKEFQNFTRTWNIVHVTSSPYHAQSNGMVERTVQTLKKLIKRCGEESTDPYLALLNLRNTPHNNLPSPAQILMSRKLRSIIPSKTSQFVPSMINNEAIQKQLVDNQVKMKNYYDRRTRPADSLSINDRVWFRKDRRWIPGQLKNQANEPRSFYVKDQEGNEYRRNRIHIIIDNTGFTKVEHRRKRLVDSEATGREDKRGCVQAAAAKPTLTQRPTPKFKVQECTTTRQKQATFRARSAAGKVDQCVYLEFCPDFSHAQYFLALEVKLGKGSVYQLTKMEVHILVGLSSVQLANKLIEEGLNIEDPNLRSFPIRKRAKRIVLGNVFFFVEDAELVTALRPYGQVTSIVQKLMQLEDSCWADARREAFIILRDGVKLSQIPARLDVKSKGMVTHVYVTYGIKCCLCYKQGHKRANCPRKNGLHEDKLELPVDVPAARTQAWIKPSSTSTAPTVAASPPAAAVVADPPPRDTVRTEEAVDLTPPTPGNRNEIKVPESSQEGRNMAEIQMDVLLKNKKASEAIARTQKLGLKREELLQALTHNGKTDRLLDQSNIDQRKASANLASALMALTGTTSSTLYKKLSRARTSARKPKLTSELRP
ncbi:K02A2.6-like [Cordylochernes scorpioides]|uniref:RNA-directed DNA polymerase n=1 Tax=Cordylochernes scorpioides TaxID=51811 RepID=A0ABY6LJR2_9ARAC|nr:K02A2.6-like [Cordylochernes scorpioides]